jgi:hypothetical protein
VGAQVPYWIMEVFEWLSDPRRRRSALRLILQSVRAGWLEAPEHAQRRADLLDALAELRAERSLSERELKTLQAIAKAIRQAGWHRRGSGRNDDSVRR